MVSFACSLDASKPIFKIDHMLNMHRGLTPSSRRHGRSAGQRKTGITGKPTWTTIDHGRSDVLLPDCAFIEQWHGLLEPRDPGAVPSPVADWKHGTDGATDGTQRVRPCRDDGKVRRLGRELVELRGWRRV